MSCLLQAALKQNEYGGARYLSEYYLYPQLHITNHTPVSAAANIVKTLAACRLGAYTKQKCMVVVGYLLIRDDAAL